MRRYGGKKEKQKKKPNDGTANLHKNSSLAYIAVHVIINNRFPVHTHTHTHTRSSSAINNAVGLVRIPGIPQSPRASSFPFAGLRRPLYHFLHVIVFS